MLTSTPAKGDFFVLLGDHVVSEPTCKAETGPGGAEKRRDGCPQTPGAQSVNGYNGGTAAAQGAQ